MYFRIYTLLGWLFVILALPFFLTYCLITGKHLSSLKQRFGSLPENLSWSNQQRIWIHAASVGEVKAAKLLITEIIRQGFKVDIIVTTVTEQGQRIAVKELDQSVITLYAPIDLPLVINRFISKLDPTIYICLETELWPNVIRILHENNIKTLLLNGRLSENSFNNYVKIKSFIGQVVNFFDTISTIQAIDKTRYIALGAAPHKITVNGNVKYDLGLPADNQHQEQLTKEIQQFRKLLHVDTHHTILIAGSTHSGEEEYLVDVFLALQQNIPNFILIIAPRHIQRLPKIKKMLARRSITFQDYSAAVINGRKVNFIIVDSMGELSKLYSVGDYIFCGGSLVAKGGHNIMEPAIFGKPPFYGPSMKDFSDACTLLEDADASFPIKSGKELATRIEYFQKHPNEYKCAGAKAKKIAFAQHGSAMKQVRIIKEALAA